MRNKGLVEEAMVFVAAAILLFTILIWNTVRDHNVQTEVICKPPVQAPAQTPAQAQSQAKPAETRATVNVPVPVDVRAEIVK